jgi:hypothetical protein
VSLRRVVVYPSQLVHYATPRPPVSLAALTGGHVPTVEEIGEDDWHSWRTICGRDVIGHPNDEFYPEVTCRSCLKAFARAQKTYSDLATRFGATP